MVDFNTKKNILQKLRKKRSENKLLWLPCVIAAAFVKLWYGTACRIGMALSDRNGNFLGIKMPEKKPKSRRKDDIVYVKKPFIGRVMSAVLAAAFVLMVAPELDIDLGINTKAVGYVNDTTSDGKRLWQIDNATEPEKRRYVLSELYDFANSQVITKREYHVSDSAVKISWNPYDLESSLSNYSGSSAVLQDMKNDITFEGYTIKILNQNEALTSNGLIAPIQLTTTECEISSSNFSGINKDTTYDIVVQPRFRLRKYWQPTTPDGTGVAIYRMPDSGSGIDIWYDMPLRTTGTDNCKYTVTPNASIESPDLHIEYMNADGTYVELENGKELFKSINSNGTGIVRLKWNKVYQQNGKTEEDYGGSEAGKEATGYRVHTSVDGGANWSATAYPLGTGSLLSDDGNGNILLPVTVRSGMHYQFYVEAYKVNWPVGNTAYNVSNKGMFTSGSQPKGNNKTRNLYTAPITPNINAEQDFTASGKPFYEITVSREAGDNNYDGILLFRTEDVELDSSLAANENYDTFAEWALDKIKGNTSQLHNLKQVHEFTKSETKYSDTDIVESKTYYYYAVAYRKINSATSVIDDTLYASGYSRAYTTFSLDGFKKTTPKKPNVSVTDDQVTVTWEPVDGAEYYEIEILQTGTHDADNKTIPMTGTVKPEYDTVNGTTYVHRNLHYSDRYQYRIRGVVKMDTMVEQRDENGNIVKDENGNTVYQKAEQITTNWSPSTEATVGTRIDTPMINNVASVDGQLTVTWTAVPGAVGYNLHYTSDDPNDREGTIRGIKGTSYVHRNLKNGMIYNYQVAAYKEIKFDGDPQNPQTVIGNYSEWYSSTRVGQDLLTPQDLKLTTKDGEITATWSPVKGATGYILYSKKDGTSGDPAEFKVTGTTFTQTGLSNGDIYTYQVRAYKTVNGADDLSGLSTPASIKVGEDLGTPQDLKTTTKDGEITISWSAVKGAMGYTLYYRRQGGGTFTPIDVTKSPFVQTGLSNGDVYEYYVVAYKEVNGKTVTGPDSVTIRQMVGSVLDAPKDFAAAAADGVVNLRWTAVKGAEGYIIHASSGGRYYQFDVSKVTYTHSNLDNGDVWTYYVTAYKTVNGTRTYSSPSEPQTVTIGISLNSAVDLTATAGNRQIDLSWTAVKGAEGYVVYLYNSSTMEFEPITVTSKTSYSHVGLKNGKQYTYMVAPYKNINGKRFYGDYSLSVTAIPTTGSITDMDHELIVKGTAPYGISHGEYITAVSNHGAFDESVDVYFTTNRESTQAIRDVLRNYADGLSSFIIYPFDISIYRENTHIEVDPADGYTVTVTIPVPDRLIAYRDYITVVHIGDVPDDTEQITLAEDWYNNYDRQLEVLPCAIVDIDNVWCVQFKCSSFSPYAFVIYKEHIQDVASGGGLLDTGFSDTFNSGLLLFTALPDILPNNRKLKIVQSGSKRYRIKSVTKR